MKVVTTKTGQIKLLDDKDKIVEAIRAAINYNKKDRVGKEHISLMAETVVVHTVDKVPLGQGKVFSDGSSMHTYTADVTYKAHREYNAKPTGQWGSHKFITQSMFLRFDDSSDAQIMNMPAVKLIDFKYK